MREQQTHASERCNMKKEKLPEMEKSDEAGSPGKPPTSR
jgi:hypothetical protein